MQIRLHVIALAVFVGSWVSCTNNHSAKKEVAKATVLLDESVKLESNSKDKIVKLDKAAQLALQLPNDSVARNLFFKVAKQYYLAYQDAKFFDCSKKGLSLAKEANDSIKLALAHTYIGDYYETQNKADSALISYGKAQKIYSAMGDDTNTARLIMNRVKDFNSVGSYDLSAIEAIKALELIKNTNDYELLYICNILIGSSEMGLFNYESAIKYYNKSYENILALERTSKNNFSIDEYKTFFFNNVGYAYVVQKKFPQADSVFQKGLQIKDIKKRLPRNYTLLINNLANSRIQSKNTTGVKEMLESAMQLSDSLSFAREYAKSTITMGEYYLLKKDTIIGLQLLKKGLELSQKNNSKDDVREVYKLLTKSDKKNRNYYANAFFTIDDQIKEEQQKVRTKFARIEFESSELEERNKKLTLQTIYGTGVIILLVGLIGVGYYVTRLRARNKELKAKESLDALNKQVYDLIIEKQFVEEEAQRKERERIGMELHDGAVNDLFTMRYNLKNLPTSDEPSREALEVRMAQAEQTIRTLSHKLGKEDAYGTNYLEDVLKTLVSSQINEYNTQFSLFIDESINWSKFTSDNKINMYRIVQEALQNVNKYAKAKNCDVSIQLRGEIINLKIADDGVGFDTEKAKLGLGLENFKKRAKTLKAKYKLTSAPKKGTTLEFFIEKK
jgi:signal transduction histidine kinase